MTNDGFAGPLSAEMLALLRQRALHIRGTSLTATTLAASGHPGGSMSSAEMYAVLYSCARLRPDEPQWVGRDRVVISHGHTSPGVYAALAEAGFFAAEQVAAHFRQTGSIFEGHVERSVPGVEWSTGNLGQGLSAGVGFAIGAKLTGGDWHTFVAMSDGEQMKGQVAEARRLAVMRELDNVTAVVDLNRIQISGHTDEVMRVPVAQDWAADGWRVYECDGHDVEALYAAIRSAKDDGAPSVVIAHTVIGKGVSFMEDDPEFHGRGLTREEYVRAMAELGLSDDALAAAVVARSGVCQVVAVDHRAPAIELETGEPRTYDAATRTDNRSAWGTALVDIAQLNPEIPIAVSDCDLAVSVKTQGFANERPHGFIECGVGEHNAATVSGALSAVPGLLSFWSDFGVFGIDEVYNQQRLNDINGAGLKLVVTHCGLDVGEDGRTHQCIDYVGALRCMFGWSVIVPADPNQTDRAVRFAAGMAGNVAVAVGRSKLPTILDEAGEPLFGGDYRFEYGEVTWARNGSSGCVLAMGTVAGATVEAADRLREEGLSLDVGIVASPLEFSAADWVRITSGGCVVSVEDHSIHTGLGASVAAHIAEKGAPCRLTRLGVTGYQSSGASSELLARAGLDAEGIRTSLRRIFT